MRRQGDVAIRIGRREARQAAILSCRRAASPSRLPRTRSNSAVKSASDWRQMGSSAIGDHVGCCQRTAAKEIPGVVEVLQDGPVPLGHHLRNDRNDRRGKDGQAEGSPNSHVGKEIGVIGPQQEAGNLPSRS